MSYNIITFGKKRENLNLAIQNEVIGSFLGTVPDYIRKNSIVFLHCESKIWGLARVSSDYFFDDTKIWPDKVYPHRFLISSISLTNNPVELTDGVYNVELRKEFGTGWAYKFLFSPKPLPCEIGKKIELAFKDRPQISVSEFLANYK